MTPALGPVLLSLRGVHRVHGQGATAVNALCGPDGRTG